MLVGLRFDVHRLVASRHPVPVRPVRLVNRLAIDIDLARLVEKVVVIASVVGHHTAVDVDDAVGERAYEMPIVTDEHDGSLEAAQRLLEDVDARNVQVVGGLVEAQQRRGGDEHLGERQTRLLATGKHAHLLVDVISLEEEGAEQRSDLGLGPSRSRLVELRKDAIAQVELLELVLGEIRELDVRTVADRTRIMGELAGDHLEQRRFARAVGADERYLVATPDVEVEVLVDPLLAK